MLTVNFSFFVGLVHCVTYLLNCISDLPKNNNKFMGYSLRVPGYRYTEWRKWNGTTLTADWSKDGLVGVEL